MGRFVGLSMMAGLLILAGCGDENLEFPGSFPEPTAAPTSTSAPGATATPAATPTPTP